MLISPDRVLGGVDVAGIEMRVGDGKGVTVAEGDGVEVEVARYKGVTDTRRATISVGVTVVNLAIWRVGNGVGVEGVEANSLKRQAIVVMANKKKAKMVKFFRFKFPDPKLLYAPA